MDLSLNKAPTGETMDAQRTNFSYEQKFKHRIFGCTFHCVGYRQNADGSIYLISQTELDSSKAKYQGEYTVENFPLVQCEPLTEFEPEKAFKFPIIPIGSKVVTILADDPTNIYSVIGAVVQHDREVNLSLVLPNKLDGVWTIPQSFCEAIVPVKS